LQLQLQLHSLFWPAQFFGNFKKIETKIYDKPTATNNKQEVKDRLGIDRSGKYSFSRNFKLD